jgi:hypothetical protein
MRHFGTRNCRFKDNSQISWTRTCAR